MIWKPKTTVLYGAIGREKVDSYSHIWKSVIQQLRSNMAQKWFQKNSQNTHERKTNTQSVITHLDR